MGDNQVDPYDYFMADEGDVSDYDGEDDDYGVAAANDTALDDYDVVTDTSAGQARKGKDIQGIPWERLNITRDSYRSTRLEQYRNYENIPLSGQAVDKECKPMHKGASYFHFFYNTRLVKPTILHFQLRNLVWATSKHDISTLAVRKNFLVAGGFEGELACKRLDKKGVSFCTRTTYEDNAITNAVEIYDSLSGGIHFMASNNDCGIREYDMEKFQLMNHFRFPWPVNHTSVSPNSKILAVVGDDLEALLVDSQNGKTISSVVGHLDYSFASAWHPDGHTFATGNQDKTCRVWDLRNLSKAVAVLKGNMGAVRSVRFSSDGQFLVVAEPADFVHVYSACQDYKKRQEIDFFGEISGVSLSPDDESLFIGVWDRTYASLLQYNRINEYKYLDSYM
ncbi:WD40/YVTN repeat-like-containing domain-containing protein [Heracleum sosnowskyi]|uniref:WD40/YVTN repeat-like-containing domain-containing protein n=1 Tax=Heracleum sosnowskyi TaxID=360622 RepID=A0AAD8GVU2_9APIA|nr:WD40/YVTN repeat-like-containing domain-containing protein [Heracleum sosnowskyi]